jgi:hypothetical protein
MICAQSVIIDLMTRERRRLIRNLKANGCEKMDKEGPVIPVGIPAKFLNCTELPALHRGSPDSYS